MNETQPQQPTPDQQKQVKKAKRILWFGLISIVVVGLAIAVYFVFINPIERDIISTNTNIVSTNEMVKFPDTEVGISCVENEDCIIVDVTESVGDCCSMPDCRIWYTSDNYVAVNSKEYYDYALEYKDNNCGEVLCPIYERMYCPTGEPYADADCQNNVCVKVLYENDILRPYSNEANGYSLMIPVGYGKNTELSGYIALDVVTTPSAKLTFNRIIVMVENTDMHTYRLSILANPEADVENIKEEEVIVAGLTANKITLKNALGETIIHYLVSYLGKVYDIETTDSVNQETIDIFIANFEITQLDEDINIADTSVFENKTCVSNNECGAYPCDQGTCLVKECNSDDECSVGTCGQYVTPVPGYCTMIDSL